MPYTDEEKKNQHGNGPLILTDYTTDQVLGCPLDNVQMKLFTGTTMIPTTTLDAL